MNAYRNVVVVRGSDMESTALFQASVSGRKLNAMHKSLETIASERADYEATRERLIDGVLQVGQSPDIRFVKSFAESEAAARMLVALGVNPREYLFPQSLEGGKTSNMTSNLKSYNKARQIAEVIFTGVSDLEGVARVSAVCMFRFANNGKDVLTRDWCENFLSSREFTSIDQGTADLWSNIDDIRAKQITGGASTQSGQVIRTLVALGSAVDVRDGRNKNVRILPDGSVMQALMTRLGQINLPDAHVAAFTASQATEETAIAE